MSEPAAWRVTLTWPRPAGWGKPNDRGYIPYRQSPEHFLATFGILYKPEYFRVERAEMRARTVIVVALAQSSPARRRGGWGDARSSSQLAVDQVMAAAVFAAAMVGGTPQEMPLPEPVSIRAEAVRTFSALERAS